MAMWIKGYITGGLVIVALCLLAAFGFVWLNVHVFNYVGYQKGLFIDGAQMAAVFGGSVYHARRSKRKGDRQS